MSKDTYQLSVMGSNNVAKIVDALTDKQDDYIITFFIVCPNLLTASAKPSLIITTDRYQSFKEDKVQSYMVGIASKFNGEQVVIYTEEEGETNENV